MPTVIVNPLVPATHVGAVAEAAHNPRLLTPNRVAQVASVVAGSGATLLVAMLQVGLWHHGGDAQAAAVAITTFHLAWIPAIHDRVGNARDRRRALQARAQVGADLHVTDADVAKADRPLFWRTDDALAIAAGLEDSPTGTGFTPGEVRRATAAEAWAVATALREAKALRRAAKKCPDPAAADQARAAAADLVNDAAARVDQLETMLEQARKLASGHDAATVLTAVARARATLEVRREHRPAAQLAALAAAATTSLAALPAAPVAAEQSPTPR